MGIKFKTMVWKALCSNQLSYLIQPVALVGWCSSHFVPVLLQTTVWTTPQPCCRSGSEGCRASITLWSGHPWKDQGEHTLKYILPFFSTFTFTCLLLRRPTFPCEAGVFITINDTVHSCHSISMSTNVKNKDLSTHFSPSLSPSSHVGELGPKHWPNSRFTHVMKLKQAALSSARALWADYILVRSPTTQHSGTTTLSSRCH